MHIAVCFQCFLLFAWSLVQSVAPANGQANEGPKMAPIWGEAQFGVGQYSGAFRLLSEVHVTNGGTFVLEESAYGPDQTFRLDLARVDSGGPSNGSVARGHQRVSVLAYGRSGDRFHFEPFKCGQFSAVDEMATFMDRDLVERITPQTNDAPKFVLAGLSSIWAWASQRPQMQEYNRATFEASKDPDEARRKKGALAARSAMNAYDHILVASNQSSGQMSAKYDIRFYVAPDPSQSEPQATKSGQAQQVGPEQLIAVHIVEAKSKRVVLRSRLIQFDSSSMAQRLFAKQADLFELPVGFGCKRSAPANASESPAPQSCLALGGGGGGSEETNVGAQMCQLELATFLPDIGKSAALNLDTSKWATQTGAMRLISGQLFGKRLVATEWTRVELDAGQLVARTRRTKLVWSLPDLAESSRPSLVLALDEMASAGERCQRVEHALYGQSMMFNFTLMIPAANKPQMVGLGAGLALNGAQMELLFSDSEGFETIRQITAIGMFRKSEFVQEKRVSSFKLYDERGDCAWTGPVSIVRQFYKSKPGHQKNGAGQQLNEVNQAHESRVRTSLHLFSEDERQLLGKIHLTLSGQSPLDQAQLHRELNVGPCLEELLSDPSRAKSLTRLARHDSLQFSLDFPIEIEQVGQAEKQQQEGSAHELEESLQIGDIQELLAQDGYARELVYAQFLANMHKLMESKGKWLHPFQMNDIEIDTSPDLVNVAAQLHKWPQVLNFHKRPGQKVVQVPDLVFIQEIRLNAEKCAESCDHYDCLAFNFCPESRECDLLLGRGEQVAQEQHRSVDGNKEILELLSFVMDKNCECYTRHLAESGPETHTKTPISPMEFLKILKQTVTNGDDGDLLKISLEINGTPVVMRPSFVETNFRLAQDSLIGGSGPNKSAFVIGQTNEIDEEEQLIEAEYEIAYENRNFKIQTKLTDEFPLQEANGMESLEDCQSLCDENDCSSFAYCQTAKTCMLSQLHESSKIRDHSEPKTFCRILARDYLSKFHKISVVAVAQTTYYQLNTNSFESALNERDCAIQCMDSDQSKCRSFLFCPTHNGPRCALLGSRYNSNIEGPEVSLISNNKSTKMPCVYYKRSYLAEFVKYHGKKLPDSGETSVALMVDGFDAENCATECAELTREGRSCQAFHVCLDFGSSRVPKFTCVIRSGTGKRIEAESLEEKQKCTSFLPIRRLQLVDTSGDYDGGHEVGESDSRPGGGSRWFATMLTILVGALVGYTLAWLLVAKGYLPRR